ncbi:uncharacterized protein FOMMEDRAFT_105696 [Fomitiporia mediterranea MF3/22]|uniref:uncharacterized protein n=1 Tax=Fomitiporia mediterranea (strain MF3/22) TaxID=694068 RepID=UPI0004408C53|nr:uncharacterized protein FOMMEDRAFT_105696 [Fomitiporia mediterranea MF3/22]EJD03599.1 hypothetical protein FOMMEDRAFT_105696 [Fomitiporia mediterranea MF3/22]
MPGHTSHGWRLVEEYPNTSIYRRPLGNTELGFYWDSVFSGTAITISHDEIVAEEGFERALFEEANVTRAWLRMKQRFPLLGALVDESPDSNTVEFVVEEALLRSQRQGEVRYTEVKDSAGIRSLTNELLNGPPTVSKDLTVQLLVVKQEDAPRLYHVLVCALHSITDGVAGVTIIREYLQELSSLNKSEIIQGLPLADRLAMIVPIEDLDPMLTASPTRRKWRKAIAKVIVNIRRTKHTGGHTLPIRPGTNPGKPAHSRSIVLWLSEDMSNQVMNTCRAQRVTFGNALAVLSQVSVSRLLHSKRNTLDGSGKSLISDDEWERRRREPMYFGGPINFRPYLDRTWYEKGGAFEICLAISFSSFVLPFMPTPSSKSSSELNYATRRSGQDSLPSFSLFLSPERYFYRVRFIQAQSDALLRHPLFYEIHNTNVPNRVSLARAAALTWRANQSDDAPSTYNHSPFRYTNIGSSLGNRDLILPRDYPIRKTPHDRDYPKPLLHILNSTVHLRCRPSELYLGALMSKRRIAFISYADINTYDEDDVKEWVEGVREACVHYLGTEGRAISPRL